MSALRTLDILEQLVGFPTVSRDSNLPLINWVRNYLADYGIESQLVHNAAGNKANMIATIGPQEAGGLILSGHTDVVPIDGQVWNSDPFILTARGCRLHGRGVCDMKGFIAVALAHVPLWKSLRLRRPIHLMFSYDEEVGCQGAPSMIEAARQALPTPAAVIIGEPTGMRLATKHKGICQLRTRIIGIEAHSSLTHQGVSAVMLAAELIAHLNESARELAGSLNPGARCFTPPFSTLSVNQIEGGTALNILAGVCEFGWDIRALPGEEPARLIDGLSKYAEARVGELLRLGKPCNVETSVLAHAPPLRADGGAAEAIARAAISGPSETIAVSFATEGGQFQQAGWSTVVCGPGSIEQAHKPDEFIERSQLSACQSFIERAARGQCRSA